MEEKVTKKEESTENINNRIIESLKLQNKELIYRLQSANMANLFKRLDYLFKVIENSTMFDLTFVDSCIKEVKELMTPPEVEEKEGKENKE